MVTDGAVPRYIAEFVGTFILIFTVGCNVITKETVWGIMSIASSLMVSIYALGDVSGANFNPAVSLALGLAKKMAWKEVIIYMGCQIAGGIAAGFSYGAMFGEVFSLSPTPGHSFGEAMVAELLYTFMLCFVVLNVAASKMHAGKNQFYGLAIGMVVVAGGYGAGHISGGCFNPAVAIGIDVSSISLGFGWCFVYTMSELVGSCFAVVCFHVCRPEELDADALPPESYELTSKLVSEFIGTFFLVLTVGLNVIGGSPAPVLSIASSLMCMVFALGSVSGAHFNPAVTVAVFLAGRGTISATEMGAYVATQIVAGVCGGFTYARMCAAFDATYTSFPLDPGTGYSWPEVMFAEVLFTFFLCFVVLSVATTKVPLTEFFGLAIGGSLIAGGHAIGSVSGGALNPAVAFGISSSHVLNGGDFWPCLVYASFEILGGCAAAAVFAVTHRSEYKPALFGGQP